MLKNISLTCALLAFWTISWALNSDSDLPLNFRAAQTDYNSKSNITLLIGQVQMQQGTTRLTADKVTLYSEDGQIKKMIAVGKPAHYTTLPENKNAPADIWGKTIEYYPKEKKAVIIGDALYVQGNTHFSGSYIIYDLKKKRVVSMPTEANTKSILIVQPQDLSQEQSHANPPSPQS